MNTYVIKSDERFIKRCDLGESRSLLGENTLLKNFKRMINIKEKFFKPNRGALPTSKSEIDIITIPLTGEIQQKTNLGFSTVIDQSSVNYLHTCNGVMYYEYNPSNVDTVRCLEIEIENPCKKKGNASNYKIKLKNKKNGLEHLLPENEVCGSKYYIYKGVLDKNSLFIFNPKSEACSAVLYYQINGSSKINADKELSQNDTYVSRGENNSLTINPITETECIIIEIS
ncbi:MAG: hypothetical protein CMC74_01355 [Flavobacteriaceae bacterium]|nr:hypothetical protein [Flavobacteriaceae bacterium]|tara:strand:- start:40327 stop:41010 length:684 start_codon:yes stop_codon:yes gene_type:complete